MAKGWRLQHVANNVGSSQLSLQWLIAAGRSCGDQPRCTVWGKALSSVIVIVLPGSIRSIDGGKIFTARKCYWSQGTAEAEMVTAEGSRDKQKSTRVQGCMIM